MNITNGGRKLKSVLIGALCIGLASVQLAKAAEKEQVLIFGDSLMKLVSRSLEREIGKDPKLDAIAMVSIGSGLARMDLFDWNDKIQKAVVQHKPKIAVVMIGANDNQPMRTASGIVELNTEQWKAEYRKRVADIVGILLDGGVRSIYWIGLPDMRDSKFQEDTVLINSIIVEQAKLHSEVDYIDTTELFSIEKGKFSPYIIDPKNAMPIHVRASDGVHLSRKGAEMLSEIVMKRIR